MPKETEPKAKSTVMDAAAIEVQPRSNMHLPGFLITWRDEFHRLRFSIMLQAPGRSAKNLERLAAFIIDEGEVVMIEYKWADSATNPATFDMDCFPKSSKRQVAIATALKKNTKPGTSHIVSTMYIKLPQKVHEKFFVETEWQGSGADIVNFKNREDEYYVLELMTDETDTAPATPGLFTVGA